MPSPARWVCRPLERLAAAGPLSRAPARMHTGVQERCHRSGTLRGAWARDDLRAPRGHPLFPQDCALHRIQATSPQIPTFGQNTGDVVCRPRRCSPFALLVSVETAADGVFSSSPASRGSHEAQPGSVGDASPGRAGPGALPAARAPPAQVFVLCLIRLDASSVEEMTVPEIRAVNRLAVPSGRRFPVFPLGT